MDVPGGEIPEFHQTLKMQLRAHLGLGSVEDVNQLVNCHPSQRMALLQSISDTYHRADTVGFSGPQMMPSELLHSVVRSLQQEFQSSGVSIDWSMAQDCPQLVEANANELQAVLVTLLRYAMPYCAQRMTIKLETTEEDNTAMIVFQVLCTGWHMTPEAFSGLSCALEAGAGHPSEDITWVHIQAQQLGGSVRLWSRMLGTLIAVAVPAQGGDVDAGQPTGSHQHVYQGAAIPYIPTSQTQPVLQRQTSGGRGERILLVEDDEFSLCVVQGILSNAGYFCSEATNGSEAVHLFYKSLEEEPTGEQGGGYDVIIMDIDLPLMDGLEATRQIRDHERRQDALPASQQRPRTVIIALSVMVLPMEHEACVEKGFDDVVVKPTSQRLLLDTIARHLQQRQYYQHNPQRDTHMHTDGLEAMEEEETSVPSNNNTPVNYHECLAALEGDEHMLLVMVQKFVRLGSPTVANIMKASQPSPFLTSFISVEANKIRANASFICAKRLANAAVQVHNACQTAEGDGAALKHAAANMQKEFLHLKVWLEHLQGMVERGQAYSVYYQDGKQMFWIDRSLPADH